MDQKLLVDCLDCHTGQLVVGTKVGIVRSFGSIGWTFPDNEAINHSSFGNILIGLCPECRQKRRS